MESLTAANQEVGAALMALASKDPKFKKGHLRGERGGRGRGRGRRQVSECNLPRCLPALHVGMTSSCACSLAVQAPCWRPSDPVETARAQLCGA